MRGLALFGLVACLAAQERPADLNDLVAAANASYLRGDYAASLDVYRKAETLAEKLPPENPQRYDVLKRLVSASSATGNFAMANAYLQQAIAWREQVLGKDDPKILTDMQLSASLYITNGDYKTARRILDTVLAAHTKSPGPDSVEVADDHSRIGLLVLDQQKQAAQKMIDEAIPEFEMAIAVRIRALGPLDPSLLPDLDRIGGLYVAQSDYEKAEATYRRALVIRESQSGAESADLIATVDGLAYSYFGEKNYDAADAAYKRLLALWEKSVGPTHPMMAIALDKVGVFYSAQKKNDEAMAAYAHANAVRAHFFATGEAEEAAQALMAGDMGAAVARYERGLKALDPANPVYDELKDTIAANIKALEQALKPPPGVKTVPKK